MDTQNILAEGLVPSPGKRVRRPGLHPLTGLRFFAAFYVMLFHFGAAFTHRAHLPEFVTIFLKHGDLGVALFFMLSGFILYYSYKDNLRTGRDAYKFFVARFARLYPVYLLALVIGAFLYMRLPYGQELLIFPMLQSWSPATSNIGYAWVTQAWTLSVEAFFYCCFPFLLIPFRRNWSSLSLWCSAAAVFFFAIAIKAPFAHPGMNASRFASHMLLPVLCLPEFLFGIVLGAIFMRKQNLSPDAFTNDWITVAGFLPCLILLATRASFYLLSFAAIYGFGWVIYRLASGRGWLTNFLSNRLMMLLGGASFSLYILQGLVRMISRRIFGSLYPGLDAALSPVILISLSCLIFLFYEEPLREFLRKLLTGRGSRTTPKAPQFQNF